MLIALAGRVTPLKLYGVTVFMAFFSSLECAIARRRSSPTSCWRKISSRALAIFQHPTADRHHRWTVDRRRRLSVRRSRALLRRRRVLLAGDAGGAGIGFAPSCSSACGWRTISLDSLRAGFSFVLGPRRHFSVSDDGFWREYFPARCARSSPFMRAIFLPLGRAAWARCMRPARPRSCSVHWRSACGDRRAGPAAGFFRRDDPTACACSASPPIALVLAVDRASDRRRNRRYDQR